MYERKTIDRWDIETLYADGTGKWETENSEYTIQDARRSLKEYEDNSCGRYAVRMKKHREKKG